MKCRNATECELDHCARNHHVTGPCNECAAEGYCDRCGYEAHDGLTCLEAEEEFAAERIAADEVRASERAAGWDPNP